MKTITLQVAPLDAVKQRAQDAFDGKKQGSRISFETPELLFQVLTAKRCSFSARSLAQARSPFVRQPVGSNGM